MLRLGKRDNVKEIPLYTLDPEKEIKAKNAIKDLGVLIDDNLSYNNQTNKAISKARQKLGWVLWTFR